MSMLSVHPGAILDIDDSVDRGTYYFFSCWSKERRQLFTCLNLDCFCWVSTLAYPNLFGKLGLKGFVVVVVIYSVVVDVMPTAKQGVHRLIVKASGDFIS